MKTKSFMYKWFILFSVFLLSNTASAETGKDMYAENCQSCHASDGRGSMGWVPDLMEEQAWVTMDENDLLNELKLGFRKSGQRMRMPAKGGNSALSDEDLRKIIIYMRKSFRK